MGENMNLPVIILGGGGHGKVLLDILLQQSFDILGFTVPGNEQSNDTIKELQLMGDDSAVLHYSPDKVLLVNGLGSVGNTSRRQRLYQEFSQKGYRFLDVIHNSAIIASDVLTGDGLQVMAGAILQIGTQIGDNTIINTKTSVDHDCRIGSHVHLAPGVTLSGNVEVGDCVHVGAGATVVQGIRIGKGSIVGAGAVVIKDVPESATVLGVPARVVKQ